MKDTETAVQERAGGGPHWGCINKGVSRGVEGAVSCGVGHVGSRGSSIDYRIDTRQESHPVWGLGCKTASLPGVGTTPKGGIVFIGKVGESVDVHI